VLLPDLTLGMLHTVVLVGCLGTAVGVLGKAEEGGYLPGQGRAVWWLIPLSVGEKRWNRCSCPAGGQFVSHECRDDTYLVGGTREDSSRFAFKIKC